MQIYQEMSIGTAKIKEDEKQGISHYLVDEYHFDEEYNVKIFQQKARDYIHAINAKKKLAMIVPRSLRYWITSVAPLKKGSLLITQPSPTDGKKP